MRVQRYTVKEKYKKQSMIAEEDFKKEPVEALADFYWLMDTQETDAADLMQAAALVNIRPAKQIEDKIFLPDILFVTGSENGQDGHYLLWRNKLKPMTFIRTPAGRQRTTELSQLAKIRYQKGFTQKALAEATGTKKSRINEYEYATRRTINQASVETAYKIAKALGCTIEDLMEKEK